MFTVIYESHSCLGSLCGRRLCASEKRVPVRRGQAGLPAPWPCAMYHDRRGRVLADRSLQLRGQHNPNAKDAHAERGQEVVARGTTDVAPLEVLDLG